MNLVNFSNKESRFSRRLHTCMLAGLLIGVIGVFAGVSASAQESTAQTAGAATPDGLAARYPGGSIQSSDTANRALVEVEQQRNALEQKYATEEHDCYAKFFATSCVDAAKERRRTGMAQIRKVEVEANAFIRADRVVQRDKKLAEKRAQDAANPPKPLADLPVKQAAQPAEDRAKENQQRLANHEAKLEQRKRDEANDAPTRAANVAAFEKKAQDAKKRQEDVAAKKAEKARQAAAKAASAASKAPAASASGSSAQPVPSVTPATPAPASKP
jgi:colicin import membrane protein